MYESHPVQLGNRRFPSKKAAADFIKMLLKSPVGKLQGDNFEIVRDLIYRHPNAGDKVGPGIKDIWLRKCQDFGRNNQFIIERTDGSCMDFSYKNCLAGKLPTFKGYFSIACRNAVASDIIAFRDNELLWNPIIFCPYTKEVLTRNNCHVDHAPPEPFAKIVDDYINENKINIFVVEIQGNTVKTFKDPVIAAHFRTYHRNKAKLRLLSIQANLLHYKV
jgi:hypothetical protein